MLIDRSVTMKGDRLDFAKQAAAVAAETLEPGDLIAVIAFDTARRRWYGSSAPATRSWSEPSSTA